MNRISCRLVAVAAAFLMTGSLGLAAASASNPLLTATDLTALARHVGGITEITAPETVTVYDCDGIAGLTAADLTRLARYVGGITDELYADTRLTVSEGDPEDNGNMTVPFPDLL